MIVIFHLTCLSLFELYLCIQKKCWHAKSQGTEGNAREIKVRYAAAELDPELGLKFDPPLFVRRYCVVREVLETEPFRGRIVKAVDFGCAEFSMFKHLKSLKGLREVLLVDVDRDILERKEDAVRPFNADFLSPRGEPLLVQVLHGSIADPDVSLLSVDAVICIEIIEHLYPDTLDSIPHNIFGFIQPKVAVFTSPNADFNVLFPNFSGFRHTDHKFEWTRQQFQDWALNLTKRYPQYSVYFDGVGAAPEGSGDLGFCSQIAVFIQDETHPRDATRAELVARLETKVPAAEDLEHKQRNYCLLCNFHEISDYVSNGVCTYLSRNNYEVSSTGCGHRKIAYELLNLVHYPFQIETRTEEEILCEKVAWMVRRYACFGADEDEEVAIDLEKLVSQDYAQFATVDSLRNLLKNSDLRIEDRLINGVKKPCVIYSNPNFESDEYAESEKNFYSATWERSSVHNDSECWDDPDPGDMNEQLQVTFEPELNTSSTSVGVAPGLVSGGTLGPRPRRRDLDAMNTDTHVIVRKRRCVEPRVGPELVLPPQHVQVEHFRVVENGDLANNNRDREGNNYQAAENVEQVYDNAMPRAENLDEDNENHIVVENNELDVDIEEDGVENLDDVSREVLYDPNSDVALSDPALFLAEEPGRSNASSRPELERFPAWLLDLDADDLDEDVIDDFSDEEVEHIGQGDGFSLFIPGLEELRDVSEPSSNSLSYRTNQETDVVADGASSVSVSAVSSSTDIQYHDALESLDDTSSQPTESPMETAKSDSTSTYSDAQ